MVIKSQGKEAYTLFLNPIKDILYRKAKVPYPYLFVRTDTAETTIDEVNPFLYASIPGLQWDFCISRLHYD